MDKKVIVKIRKIAYSKLRKLEVYRFYNDVIDIISDYDTKAMHIGDSCGVLIDMQPKAQLLKLTNDDLGPSRLTPKVDSLHEKRLKFAATITNQMSTLEMAGLEDKLDLVKLSKDMVYHYLNYLRQKDKESIDGRIASFFHRLKQEPEVKDALYKLGFKTYLDEFEAAHKRYLKTIAKRNAQESRRHKGNTIPIQRELQNIMNILFDQVNYYQHVYKDIDYSGLITALNHTIAVYTKLIKTRDTQRKNKKLKAQQNAEAPLEEKAKMDGIDKSQSTSDDPESAIIPSAEQKEIQKETPPASAENLKGKVKPINGLMDILKRKDKGGKDSDEGQK